MERNEGWKGRWRPEQGDLCCPDQQVVGATNISKQDNDMVRAILKEISGAAL